jgi:A/G-specific adenine glycosylase
MGDGDKIPPFSKRKTFMDARLAELFGKAALSRSSKSIPERRDVGELTHVFSHVKHHMGIEHLHFKAQAELLPAADADELRWMTVSEMQQLGITTGVKKILQLVLHPDKTKVKAKSSATSAVANRGTKRLKTIASFFKK